MHRHESRRPADSISEAEMTRADNLKSEPTLPVLIDHVAHVQRRVLVDAVLDAWPAYWERRARALEAARPVPGEYIGRATRWELSAQWQRLTEAAAACRARAQVSPLEDIPAEVDGLLGEVA